ncbi:MAG: hypothetical protein ACRC6V_06645 [Bacteroidales bacterium]
MKKALLVGLVATAALSGCAAKVGKPMPSGNGTEAFVVQCNGAFQEWSQCYEKAAEICGPYFYTSNEQASSRTFGGALIFGSVKDRSMVVECTPLVDEDLHLKMQQLMSVMQKASVT